MLAFQELIERSSEVGAHPESMRTLLELMEDPLVAADDLIPIVEQDSGLTANLLKLCNSPSYSYTREIGSVREALVMVGNISFTKMAFMVCMEQLLLRDLPVYRLSHHDVWRHSLSVAVGSAYLARSMGLARMKDRAFTAGMLHDIGKLLLDGTLRGHVRSEDYHGLSGITVDHERLVTGFDHAEAGAAILSYWDFPPLLVQAVRCHHSPSWGGPHGDVIRCLFAADTITHLVDNRTEFDPEDLDSPYIPVLDAGFPVSTVRGLQTALYNGAGDIIKMALQA